MRLSCLMCASKHLSAAEILMQEAMMGYSLHAWLACGHLEQAESELLNSYPKMAAKIRTHRIKYSDSLQFYRTKGDIGLRVGYYIPTMELLKELVLLKIKQDLI